jgi:hypothetical protein
MSVPYRAISAIYNKPGTWSFARPVIDNAENRNLGAFRSHMNMRDIFST